MLSNSIWGIIRRCFSKCFQVYKFYARLHGIRVKYANTLKCQIKVPPPCLLIDFFHPLLSQLFWTHSVFWFWSIQSLKNFLIYIKVGYHLKLLTPPLSRYIEYIEHSPPPTTPPKNYRDFYMRTKKQRRNKNQLFK